LTGHLLGSAGELGARRAYLEVAAANTPALASTTLRAGPESPALLGDSLAVPAAGAILLLTG
jgi:hypothetical protein